MDLEPVLTTAVASEAEFTRALLESQGLHPFIQGGQSGGLMSAGFHGLVEMKVLVPAAEKERALAFLNEAKVQLDGPLPDGESLEGAVCPVHEQAAVATCDRCGTFLCAQCGALGSPPLCEECVARPAAPVERAPVMKAVARGYVLLWALGALGFLGFTVLALAARAFGWFDR